MAKIDSSWYTRPEKIRESVSAGGIVVRIEDRQAWIALVREMPLSEYILPKGQVEAGEGIEAAALREIEEEAGLSDLQFEAYLGERQRLNYAKDRWKIIHYFLFITRQTAGAPTDPSHDYRCEWFPTDALPEFFWPEQRQLVLETLAVIRSLLD